MGNSTEPEKIGGQEPGKCSAPPEQILVVGIDDDATILEFYKSVLGSLGVRYESSEEPARGLELVETLDPALVLLDLNMEGMDGLEVLEHIRARNIQTQVVMITGNYSIETAVEAIRQGATDYVCKPVSIEKLRGLVEQARLAAHHFQRAESLEKELIQVFALEAIIGHSPRMLEVFLGAALSTFFSSSRKLKAASAVTMSFSAANPISTQS